MNLKICIIFIAISPISMIAHAQTNDTSTTGTSSDAANTEGERRGFGPGWMGLLGLAGLAGLLRKKEYAAYSLPQMENSPKT